MEVKRRHGERRLDSPDFYSALLGTENQQESFSLCSDQCSHREFVCSEMGITMATVPNEKPREL